MADFREMMSQENQGGVAYKCFLDQTVRIIYVDELLVSAYEQTEIFTGGAHPNHLLKTLNFGKAPDGKVRLLKLADIMAPGADASMLFAEFTDPVLRGQKRSRGAPEDYDPDPTLEDRFVIDRDSITWYFEPYSVGSYAEGGYYPRVPTWSVRDRLDPKGPCKNILARFRGLG